MSAFDLVAPELELLPGTRPKALFGHRGFAVGNSVYAFMDDDGSLVVKTEKYPTAESLPPKLTHFYAGNALMKSWVRIPVEDDLRSARKHWLLIEESYRHALVREQLKKKRGK